MASDEVPAYEAIALVYDRWMEHDGAPYEQWCGFVDAAFRGHESEIKTVLEVGCGTGSMTQRLGQRGYQVTGVDASPAMLRKAREKLARRSNWSRPACLTPNYPISALTTRPYVASTL